MAKDTLDFLLGKLKTFKPKTKAPAVDAVESFETKLTEKEEGQIDRAKAFAAKPADWKFNGKRDWFRKGEFEGKPGYWVQFGRPAIGIDDKRHKVTVGTKDKKREAMVYTNAMFFAETPKEVVQILEHGKELLKMDEFKARIKLVASERGGKMPTADEVAIAETGADQGDSE